MAERPQITLYDVPSTLKEKSVFLFVLRLRFVFATKHSTRLETVLLALSDSLLLDYKNIQYETQWIDFPDVERTAKAIGAPPTKVNSDGNPGYTVPFITVSAPDEPTFALSGSAKIAEYIEDTFPDSGPRLLPKETRVFQAVFTKYLTEKVLNSVFRTILIRLIGVMPAHTQEWFIESRKRIVGRGLKELVPQDEASMEEAWKRFDAAFDDLAAHLDKAGVGNYRITGGVSYAEFELISILNLIKRVSFDKAWKRLEGRNGGRWAKLMDLPLYRKLLPANHLCAML